MAEIKPCKKCNEKSDLCVIREDYRYAYVKCLTCGYIGPDATNEKEAIDAWNRREKNEMGRNKK